MKTILISIIVFFASISLYAQNSVVTVLKAVEENNTTLKALKETTKAQKLENKTGIYLSNPEVEFNYLWGNPSAIGNRTDFNISQTFDIPTITGMKRKMADERNGLVEWQYKAERMNILLETKQYCLELIYLNALKKELEIRLQHAQTIASGYQPGLLSVLPLFRLFLPEFLFSVVQPLLLPVPVVFFSPDSDRYDRQS
jgi:hypothetical protein